MNILEKREYKAQWMRNKRANDPGYVKKELKQKVERYKSDPMVRLKSYNDLKKWNENNRQRKNELWRNWYYRKFDK